MTAQRKISRTMNILLWVAQALLTITLLWVGSMKLSKPESLPFPWVKEHPDLVLITGIVDLLGGLGIVLPVALDIRPGLTIFAAYGIAALMIVAILFHIARGEGQSIGINIFFLLLAVFIARGRRKPSME